MTHLRLTDEGNREGGLILFSLVLWHQDKIRHTWQVYSGAPGRQTKRIYTDPKSLSGSLEPIPEAEYNLGPVEFAGGRDNYSASWGAGLGPVWVSIIPTQHGSRGDFGFHLDANRNTAPGSAGCIVFRDVPQLKSFVSNLRQYDPKRLVVDYALGTVAPATVAPTRPDVVPVRLWANDNGLVLDVQQELAPGQYQVYTDAGGWAGKFKRK